MRDGRSAASGMLEARVRANAGPYLEEHGEAPAAVGAGRTVLVAEDEDGIRGLCATILQRHGYRVLQARDGQEALRIARQHPGPIHLLLTDIMMPGLSGVMLGESLARSRPDTKVLLMSGVPWNRADARFAFLQKPFAYGTLLAKVRQVLEEEQADSRAAELAG